MEIVAARALTTRQTVSRIEKGDPRVAMGTWAGVLFALGLANRLRDLAAPGSDELGLSLEGERLPTQIHLPKSSRKTEKRLKATDQERPMSASQQRRAPKT